MVVSLSIGLYSRCCVHSIDFGCLRLYVRAVRTGMLDKNFIWPVNALWPCD
jgi:hypothetical protein